MDHIDTSVSLRIYWGFEFTVHFPARCGSAVGQPVRLQDCWERMFYQANKLLKHKFDNANYLFLIL